MLQIVHSIIVAVASAGIGVTHQKIRVRSQAVAPKSFDHGVWSMRFAKALSMAATPEPVGWRWLTHSSLMSIVVQGTFGIAPYPASAIECRDRHCVACIRLSVVCGYPSRFSSNSGDASRYAKALNVRLGLDRSGPGKLLVQLGNMILSLGKLQLQSQDFFGVGQRVFNRGARRASRRSCRLKRVGCWRDRQGVARRAMIQVPGIHLFIVLTRLEGFILLVKDSLLFREPGQQLVHGVGIMSSVNVANHLVLG